MKKLSFQRFSPRAWILLGLCTSFATCAMAADTQQPAEVPVTVPVAILDALMQTSQVGVAIPALSSYSSYPQEGRIAVLEPNYAWGGWKSHNVNIDSSAASIALSQDIIGRPGAFRNSYNSVMRLGLLGRVSGFSSTVKYEGFDTIKQQTNVLSAGFYARLQTSDDQNLLNLYRHYFYPKDERNSIFTFWAYLNYVSGNTINNPKYGSPWGGWSFSLNGSIEKTVPLYYNEHARDEVGIRWSVLLKPLVQAGVYKFNLRSFPQLNNSGLYGGDVKLNTRTHMYFKLGVRLQYQGNYVAQITDDPVRFWNVFVGASYFDINNPTTLELPNAGQFDTSAARSQFQYEAGAGFTEKAFRVALKYQYATGKDHYYNNNVTLTLGYQF